MSSARVEARPWLAGDVGGVGREREHQGKPREPASSAPRHSSGSRHRCGRASRSRTDAGQPSRRTRRSCAGRGSEIGCSSRQRREATSRPQRQRDRGPRHAVSPRPQLRRASRLLLASEQVTVVSSTSVEKSSPSAARRRGVDREGAGSSVFASRTNSSSSMPPDQGRLSPKTCGITGGV